MYNQRGATPVFSERMIFLMVFGLIALLLGGGSIWAVSWIRGQVGSFTPAPQTSPVFTNYSNLPSDYLKPESLAAMAQYITSNPQPQNVQVLTGMDTAAIANYMVAQVAGGLKVDCTYCHNLANGNFAAEDNLPMSTVQNVPRKTLARQMMLMSQDLNKNYVAKLPVSVGGKAITCATCHNGNAVNFNGVNSPLSNYPANQAPLPRDYQLKLETPADLDLLIITGKKDPNLAAVQYNQYTMTHLTQALGVGCAFCHNANYFPSYQRDQKTWALTMLQMAQHINTTYKPIMAQKAPSCWMCHRGQQLPPGSANPGQVPAVLGYTSQ